MNYDTFQGLYADKINSGKKSKPSVDRNLVDKILKVNSHIFGENPQININNDTTTPEQMYEEMCRKEEERKKEEKDKERKPKLPQEYLNYLIDLKDCDVNPKVILDLGKDDNFFEEAIIVWPNAKIIKDTENLPKGIDLIRLNLGSYPLDVMDLIQTQHLIVEMFDMNTTDNIEYLRKKGFKCIGEKIVKVGSYGVYTFIYKKVSDKVKIVNL